jgi:hypothetical protein
VKKKKMKLKDAINKYNERIRQGYALQFRNVDGKLVSIGEMNIAGGYCDCCSDGTDIEVTDVRVLTPVQK